MKRRFTIVFSLLCFLILQNSNCSAYTVLPANSATQLKVVSLYGMSIEDANELNEISNMYSQNRVDDNPPSMYIEYETAYDKCAREHGMQMELQFQTIFSVYPQSEWENKIKKVAERFAAGDRLVGLRQVVGPDEPYHNGWTKADLEYALGLLKKYFPNAKTRVNFVRNDAVIYGPPANLDIVSMSWYPFLNSSSPDEATFKSTLVSRIQDMRNAGFTQPMHLIGQAYFGSTDDDRRMPTSEEMLWYYEVLEDPANASLNVEGLYWYIWWTSSAMQGVGETTDGTHIGDGGTALYPDQIAQLKEIAKAVGRLEAPPSKAHYVAFNGSTTPDLAYPKWTLAGNTAPVSSYSDGKIYHLETDSAANQICYWNLVPADANLFEVWKADNTVQMRVRWNAVNATIAGGAILYCGTNQRSFAIQFLGNDTIKLGGDTTYIVNAYPEWTTIQFNTVKYPSATSNITWADVYIDGNPTPLKQYWIGSGNDIGVEGFQVGDCWNSNCGGVIDIDYIGWTNGQSIGPDLILGAELDQSGEVNFNDFAIMASEWMGSSAGLLSDIDHDGTVDINDLEEFANSWLLY